MTTSIEPKRILFLCSENSFFSQMAEAFARGLAQGSVDARSAGLIPLIEMDPRAIELMRERNYDMHGHRTKCIEEVAGQNYDVTVTIGPITWCPKEIARHCQHWRVPTLAEPSLNALRCVRDLIESNVKLLLERVQHGQDDLTIAAPSPVERFSQENAFSRHTF